MRANELRLGNLVNRLGKIEIITGITKGIDISYDFIATNKSGVITSNQIEPIPLTEEILSDSEMVNLSGCYYFWKHSMFFITKLVKANKSIAWDVYATSETHLTEIKYVHQLQNLYFALTGEELVLS